MEQEEWKEENAEVDLNALAIYIDLSFTVRQYL